MWGCWWLTQGVAAIFCVLVAGRGLGAASVGAGRIFAVVGFAWRDRGSTRIAEAMGIGCLALMPVGSVYSDGRLLVGSCLSAYSVGTPKADMVPTSGGPWSVIIRWPAF